ncbi:unnamed protein product [Staurois parvus]|uniref:Uncharacterized protein n=1 Tax=Staurois parvus TaxID=386267 RepID=A0ABN9EXW4_9NEOB|nr:unnamed protein product [Staurois parvus]
MALGRKGLTSRATKVNWVNFTVCCVTVSLSQHTALYGSA